MKNKCQNRVPGHPIYKVGHNLTGFNNILEGGIVPLRFTTHITKISWQKKDVQLNGLCKIVRPPRLLLKYSQ